MSWTHCVLGSHTDTARSCVGKALSAHWNSFALHRYLPTQGTKDEGKHL